MKTFTLCIILILVSFLSQSQHLYTNRIHGINAASTICANKAIFIHYDTTGKFNADNIFSVKYSRGNDYPWQYVSVKDSSGILKFIIPANAPNQNFTHHCNIIISSSSPKIDKVNNDLTITVVETPQLTILSASNTQVNPYDKVTFIGTLSGTEDASTNVVFSDSTKLENIRYLTMDLLEFRPSKTGVYTIKQLSNVCGIGSVSGSVAITVQTSSLKIISVPTQVCQKSDIRIGISKQGTWPSNASFKVRLIKGQWGIFDFPAKEENGVVTAFINDTIPLNETYQLEVISTNPNVVGKATETVTVYEPARIYFDNTNQTFDIGQTGTLHIKTSGTGVFSAVVNKGLVNFPFITTTSFQEFNIRPKTTTTYKLTSSSSSLCTVNQTLQDSITITVRTGVSLEFPNDKSFCSKDTCFINYMANPKLAIGKMINVYLTPVSNSNTTYLTIKGIIQSDSTIRFILPDTLITAGYYQAKIEGSTSITSNTITLLGVPNISLFDSTTVYSDSLLNTNLYIYLEGGAPYTINIKENNALFPNRIFHSKSDLVTIPISIKQSELWAIDKITNACSQTAFTPSLKKNFIISIPPSNILEIAGDNLNNYANDICAFEKINLHFKTKGTFNNDNLFKVSLVPSDYTMPEIKLDSTKSQDITIELPSLNDQQCYYLKVTSTSPVVSSNLIPVFVKEKATAKLMNYLINPNNFPNVSILAGTSVSLITSISGSYPAFVSFSDGNPPHHAISQWLLMDINPEKYPNPVILQVSNQCGIGTIDTTTAFSFKVIPYRLVNDLNTFDNQKAIHVGVCKSNSIIVPFHTEGIVPSTTTFSIQIAKENDTTFIELKKGVVTSPAIVEIPQEFPIGNYKIRIVSSENIQSSSTLFILEEIPNNPILLTADNKQRITIKAGETTPLKISPTIISPIINEIRESSGIHYITTEIYMANYTIPVSPLKTTTYTLLSSTNQCGTSFVNESVEVQVVPSITISAYPTSTCENSWVGFNVQSLGDFAPNNTKTAYFYEKGSTSKKVFITNISDGFNSFQMPPNLPRGTYTLEVASSSPAISNAVFIDLIIPMCAPYTINKKR